MVGPNGVSAFIVAESGGSAVGGGRGGVDDGGIGPVEGGGGDSKLKVMLLSRLRDASRT